MRSLIPVELMQRLLIVCLVLTLAVARPAWSQTTAGGKACDMPTDLTTFLRNR